jgi:elongation factor Ts
MAEIDAKTVMALRKQTGAPMMDCKAALLEAGGDMERAGEVLRKRGLKTASDKAGREAAEGQVFTYVHPPGRIGVMVEVACETDFVARNADFQQFGKDLCLHIAFAHPLGMTREDLPPQLVEKERRIVLEQTQESMAGRPDEVVQKAVEGRMAKFFAERCLLEQAWVKDDKLTVEDVRKQMVAKIQENIQVRRFARFELGE